MYYDKDGDLKPGKKGNIIFAKTMNFTVDNQFKKIYTGLSIFQYFHDFCRNMLIYATMAKVHGCCGGGG